MAKIISLNENHIDSIVKLHRLCLPGRILTLINPKLLAGFYELLLKTPDVYGFCSLDKSKVTGFIVGTTDTTKLFRQLVGKIFGKPFLIGRFLWQGITSPTIFFKVLSLLFYPSKSQYGKVRAELLVVAVDPCRCRQNIGTSLVKALEQSFKKEKIPSYKVNVEESNKNAREFYRQLDFEKRLLISQFGNKWFILAKEI